MTRPIVTTNSALGSMRPKRRNAPNCSTVPTHDLVFGAKRCQRLLVTPSGGSNGESVHPNVSCKVGGPAHPGSIGSTEVARNCSGSL